MAHGATDPDGGRRLVLVEVVHEAAYPLVLVTNEVDMGVVPPNELSRRFRDHGGRLHQQVASVADEVHLAALGTILQLRPGPVREASAGIQT